MKNLEFWFDFASPYSYISAMRIESAVRTHPIRINWKPFVLGVIFQRHGWHDSPFNVFDAKGKYMWHDISRTCHELHLDFQRPSIFPRHSVLASRVVCTYEREEWINQFIQHMFKANFVHDQDISQRDIISTCLINVGQNPELILKELMTPEHQPALRLQTQRAIQLGIFGAPTFMADGELFWGNDRLEQAIDWCLHPRTYL